MALLTLLVEDFELASLFLLALETPGTAEDDLSDLPEAEATSDDLPWLLGVLVVVLVGEDDTSDDSPELLGELVGASIGDIVGTLPSAVGDVVGASVKAWGLLVGLASSTGLTVGFVEGAT